MNIKASILFLLIFLPVMAAFSGKEYKFQPAPVDGIVLKSADHKAMEAYRNNSDFDYKEQPVQGWYNFLPGWLKNYLVKFFQAIFGSRAAEIVFILLITSAALYILLRLNGINPAVLLKGNPNEIKNAVYSEGQDLQLVPYDKLIDEAVMAGDFRLAIRMHFLDILIKLEKKGIITFKEDKTNRGYYNEINQPSVKKGFLGVAGIFENVWYGELVISRDQYTELEKVISELRKGMGL